MPLETRSRVPLAPRLDLPPPFRLVMLREAGDAFAHAKAIAAAEGAGTLVHVGRFDLAEFAVVLEPEEPLRSARRALYVGLCALGDALAGLAPPEKPISFDWPDAIRVDGGLVGGVRLGWPPAAEEDEPPAWLVFGGVIRMVAMGEGEPGVWPLAAALEQEGFEDPDPGRLVESFARHLMATVEHYRESGFGEVAKRYLSRLRPEAGLAPAGGPRKDIDQQGDLLVQRPGGKLERHPIIEALAAPSWLDPKTGGPRVKPLPHETIR
jgi:biotin-(acetyl-CoA carboxylase) ligase